LRIPIKRKRWKAREPAAGSNPMHLGAMSGLLRITLSAPRKKAHFQLLCVCDALQMKQHIIAALWMTMAGTSAPIPPSELLIRSCLLDRSAGPSVSVHDLSTSEVIEDDDYVVGFNAPYFFKYQGKDVGYAES